MHHCGGIFRSRVYLGYLVPLRKVGALPRHAFLAVQTVLFQMPSSRIPPAPPSRLYSAPLVNRTRFTLHSHGALYRDGLDEEGQRARGKKTRVKGTRSLDTMGEE
jgi:hypothetical protein